MSSRNASYCAVSVVCERRRLDVALPATVPVTDLVPALLRLLLPADAPDPPARWHLVPIGRPTLQACDTLDSAGILEGEVLLLEPVTDHGPPPTPAASLRDHLEDVVAQRDRAWTAQTSARFLFWLSAAVGAALVVPAAGVAGGPTIALQVGVAGLLAVVAVAAAGRAEHAAATVALLTGCGWCALAGWAASAGGGVIAGVAAAVVAALLLAAAALPGYPGALVHVGALGVLAIGAGTAGVAAAAGAHLPDTAVGLAVMAVLAIGVAPRMVLAATGFSPSATEDLGAAAIAPRFARADRLLIGVLIGSSLLAVVCALPAAFAGDALNRAFAVGIGVSLLLRSRVFSQVPHLLAGRVPGVAALAAAWAGWYLAEPGLRGLLVALPMVILAVVTAAVGLMATTPTAVARARAARVWDIAEQLLVVALVVLATGLLGLFAWVGSVLS